MDTLTRALRDAAAEAPTTLDVGEEQWVDASWRSGRRRRVLRGVATGAGLAATAALVVSLVAAGIGGMPSASVPADGSSRSAGDGVSSYPQRIGHQWWVRDLPATPGPVAGVVETYEQDGDRTISSWEVVTPRGTRYRLPEGLATSSGIFPAVSDDGTRVGSVGEDGAYRVQDTVGGTVVTFDQVGVGNLAVGSDTEFVDGRSYGLQMQSPGFFSPGGEAVAVLGSGSTSTWSGVLVLAEDGSVTEVPGMGQAAGWLDDDRLLGRVLSETELQQGDVGVDLVVWDRRTGRTTPLVRIALPPAKPQTVNRLNGQFWGAVRSDGTLWVTYSVEAPSGSVSENQQLVGYALPSGDPVDVEARPLAAPQPAVRLGEGRTVPYQRFWHGTTALAGTSGEPVEVVPADGRGDPLVVVDPMADVTQVIWAQAAIDGSPSWSPFGTWDAQLLWWWKEIVLVGLLLGAYRLWLSRRRRRRESRRTARLQV